MAFLPAITAIAGIASAGLAGVSAYQEKKAGEAAATYNAQASDMAAAAELDAAAVEAQDRRRKLEGQRATSLAARGASGVAFAGTPLMVDEDMLGEIELDIARIGQRGAAKATQYENQATLDRMTARNNRRAAPVSAGASLLGGLAKVNY